MTICAKFKFVSESNIFRGDSWKRERESCKEWNAERYYNALLSSEGRVRGWMKGGGGGVEEVWKSRLNRTPLSERQRISSGEVCWESTGKGGEGGGGGKRPSKQFYRDSGCRVTFFMLDTPFLLLSLSSGDKYGDIIENRRDILDVSFLLRSRMRSGDGGWSFDYSVSCYLRAINVPPFV